MSTYLLHHYDAAEADEQQLFSELLQEQDPEIMDLINGQVNDQSGNQNDNKANASRYNTIIRKIRQTLIAGA